MPKQTAAPSPFYVAIVDKVKEIRKGVAQNAPFVMDIARLATYADLTTSCRINDNHDAIAEAFAAKFGEFPMNETSKFGELFIELFDYIDAEKARCEELERKVRWRNDANRS